MVVLLGVILGAAAVLWLRPLRSSLWLDEAGTFWVIKDGLHSTVERALHIQGQSPFYYLLALGATRAGGVHEWVLRLPSVLSAGLAAVGVFKLACRLFDRETGVLSVLSFLALSGVAFAAVDARPYALALAACAWAGLALVRYLDGGRTADRVTFIVLSATTVYAHYLFGLAFVSFGAYVLARRGRAALRSTIATAAWIGALCVPLAWQLSSLVGRRQELSWAGPPSAGLFVIVVAQPLILLGIGIFVRHVAPPGADSFPKLDGASGVLLIAWSTAPPVIAFLVSEFTSIRVFEPRYYLAAAPSLAVLAGWTLRGLHPAIVRTGLAVVLALVVSLTAQPGHGIEDWRGAARFVASRLAGPNTALLVRSGLVEARGVPSGLDHLHASFVLSPFSYYPVSITPTPLPFSDSPAEILAVRALSDRAAADDRVLLVTNENQSYVPVVQRELENRGFKIVEVRWFGAIRVAVCDRA